MKLTHAILAVMLDGKEHDEEEIVARVRHFVDPSKAVRGKANEIMVQRERCRRRNKTDKTAPRKEDVQPETMNTEEAIRFVIAKSMRNMANGKKGIRPGLRWIESVDGNGTWRLIPESREYLRNNPKGAASAVAGAIKRNLLAKGELI